MTTAMKAVVLVLVAALPLAGCATLHRNEERRTEDLLESAGFLPRSADTPEQLASMNSMPRKILVTQERDGDVLYTYADPDRCHCVYVGGPEEYSAYQRLLLDKQLAKQKAEIQKTETDATDQWPWW